jgi:Ca2+-binding RTX toxin-like protein
MGAGISNTTIDSNHVHDSNPWRWGDTANNGDHADFLALWTSPTQTAASTNINITNNLMEQGKGTAILGMWLQGDATPFSNVTISGNAFLDGNLQGITLSGVNNSTVDHNTLLQTSGGNSESAPSILLAVGSEKISVHDNLTSAYNDTSGSTGALANTASNNTVVQKFDASKAGYYGNDLLLKAEASHDISGLYGTVAALSTTTITPIVTAPVLSAPVVTIPVVTIPVVTVPIVTAPVVPAPSAPATTGPDAGLTLSGAWDWGKLVGGSGNDTFYSKTTGDTLVGGAGDDTYNLIGGSKTLVVEAAGGGVDTVISKGDYTLGDNVENLTLAPASDNWGGTGNGLNNVIKGNAGGNFLDGGAGNDTIDGGAGNDYITGGTGNDLLTGGAGKDTFRFAPGSGRDTITDFSKIDHDAIDITAYMKAGAKVIVTDVGTDVQISFSGTTDAITLTGVHAKDLVSTFYGFTA